MNECKHGRRGEPSLPRGARRVPLQPELCFLSTSRLPNFPVRSGTGRRKNVTEELAGVGGRDLADFFRRAFGHDLATGEVPQQ